MKMPGKEYTGYVVRASIGLLLAFFICTDNIAAQITYLQPDDLKEIDVIENQGQFIPLEIEFVNSEGDTVEFGSLLKPNLPVILTLYYSDCPMLCSMVLNGLKNGIDDLAWKPGEKFNLISVSINPDEKTDRNKQMEERYAKSLTTNGEIVWKFMSGKESNIKTLANTVGFKYYKVEETGQYAHPAVVIIITDKGMVSRYLYGIEFKEQDLRLALLEASEGKIGNTIDRILLYCFHYDPNAGGYVLIAGRVMTIGGVISVLLLAIFLGSYWIKDIKKRAV